MIFQFLIYLLSKSNNNSFSIQHLIYIFVILDRQPISLRVKGLLSVIEFCKNYIGDVNEAVIGMENVIDTNTWLLKMFYLVVKP